jgi:dTMP kinase
LVLSPDGGPIQPIAELLLFIAARAQHVAERIRPALEAGQIVVCDRFTDATLAYQGGGRAVPRDLLARLNEVATGGLRPDRTYLLDVDVATGFARAGERAGQPRDRIESEDTGFFESVRRRYLDLAAEDPERIVLLRGNDSQEDLARQIRVDVLTLLRSRDIQPSR